MAKWKWFKGARSKVHGYFLEEHRPFHRRRKFKSRNVQIVLIAGIIALVFFVLALGGKAEKEEQAAKDRDPALTHAQASDNVQAANAAASASSGDGSIALGGGEGWSSSRMPGASRGGGSARQYGASQIVRADSGGGNGLGIPLGTTITAKLVNALLSSDSAQPVVAEIPEDAVWRGSVLIPAGSRVIGGAAFDETSQRLQVRFNTFVYPEGDQHPVSAIGLLSDGSSGIPGDYHSGETKKAVGQFLGDFIGGLATGMQDRQSVYGGGYGMTLEAGSLRNGVLNGISNSALDEGKSASDGMKNVHPYLTVPGGTTFLLYFEKEYSP